MALKKYKIYLDTFINSVNYLSDQNLQVFLEMKEVWLSDVYEDWPRIESYENVSLLHSLEWSGATSHGTWIKKPRCNTPRFIKPIAF